MTGLKRLSAIIIILFHFVSVFDFQKMMGQI